MKSYVHKEIGNIVKTKNAYSSGHDISYWANFTTQYRDNKIIINGECKCNGETSDFEFDYYPDTEIVVVNQDFMMCLYDHEETFKKYNEIIRYGGVKNTDACVLPWVRFPKTRCGVLVPLLVETVLGKMPNQIEFY
jgi:hypothetical protein